MYAATKRQLQGDEVSVRSRGQLANRHWYRMGDTQHNSYRPAADAPMPPIALSYRPRSDVLAAGWECGLLSLLYAPDSRLTLDGRPELRVVQEEVLLPNAIFDIHWLPHRQDTMLVSHARGACLVSGETLEVSQAFFGNRGSLKAVSINPLQPNIFCGGTRSGQLVLGDMRASEEQVLMDSLSANHRTRTPHKLTKRRAVPDKPPSITCVSFVPNQPNMIVSSCDTRAELALTDMRFPDHAVSTTPVHPSLPRCGISWLSLDSWGDRAYAITRLGVMMFELGDMTRPAQHLFQSRNFDQRSFFLRSSLSTDDATLACTSSNGKMFLWDVHQFDRPPVILQDLDETEIGCVAWHPNGYRLAYGGDSGVVRLWDNECGDGYAEAGQDGLLTLQTGIEDDQWIREPLITPSPLSKPKQKYQLVMRKDDVRSTAKKGKKSASKRLPVSTKPKKSFQSGDIRKFLFKRPISGSENNSTPDIPNSMANKSESNLNDDGSPTKSPSVTMRVKRRLSE